jgi:hypothetical protein
MAKRTQSFRPAGGPNLPATRPPNLNRNVEPSDNHLNPTSKKIFYAVGKDVIYFIQVMRLF